VAPSTSVAPSTTVAPSTSVTLSTPAGSDDPAGVDPAQGAPAVSGVIEVGDQAFDLAVTCHRQESIVVALGQGTHPESGADVAAVVQVAPSAPYVGVVVDGPGGIRYEAALDAPIELAFDGERIQSGPVEFLADLDLATGEGDPAGEGRVDLRCDEVLDGLPEGWVTDSREARPGEDVPSGTR
jgi:hypothetical protein